MRQVICIICILVSQLALSAPKKMPKSWDWHVSCQNKTTSLIYVNNSFGTSPVLYLNDAILCRGNEVKISSAIESIYMMIRCDLTDASIFVSMPQLGDHMNNRFEASLEINDTNLTLQCKSMKTRS